MKKNIVIIILSLIILGLGGYLVYDKVTDNEETKVNNIEDKKEEQLETEKEVAIVTDLVNGKVILDKSAWEGIYFEEGVELYVKASIPYINIDTQEVKKLNEKIQTEYSYVIDIIKNNKTISEEKTKPGWSVINYNYTIRNNILFIYIESYSAMYHGSGGIENTTYYYDIENDKVLTVKEVLNKFNITEEDLISRINFSYSEKEEQLKNEIKSDLDANVSIFFLGNSMIIQPSDPRALSFNELKILINQ